MRLKIVDTPKQVGFARKIFFSNYSRFYNNIRKGKGMNRILGISFVATVLVLFSNCARAEERVNNISIEGLGRAGLYSINYDRNVSSDWAVGIGFSTYSISLGAQSSSAYIFPLYVNYYLSSPGNGRFFATAGADIIITSGDFTADGVVESSGIALVTGAGYEYKSDGGFLFRIAPYLLLGNASGAWLGISLGYSL